MIAEHQLLRVGLEKGLSLQVVDAVTEVEIDTYGRYGPTDRPHPAPVVIDAVRIERPDVGIAEN